MGEKEKRKNEKGKHEETKWEQDSEREKCVVWVPRDQKASINGTIIMSAFVSVQQSVAISV